MRIGLCLSGGGIKGAAHIGVLKAFEEEKIKITMISGASSGNIVATLFAKGYKLRVYELYGNTDVINIETGKINILDSSKIDELYEKGSLMGKRYINKT